MTRQKTAVTLEQYRRIAEVRKIRHQTPNNKELARELGLSVTFIQNAVGHGIKRLDVMLEQEALASARVLAESEAVARHRDRRERIATAAMAGMLADPSIKAPSASDCASSAVELADALIAELDKPKEVKP